MTRETIGRRGGYELLTVTVSTEPVQGSGALIIVPDYLATNAPAPDKSAIPTAGGMSAGIDVALRVVSRSATQF